MWDSCIAGVGSRKATNEMSEEETVQFSVRAEHYTDETTDASEPVLPGEFALEFTMLHLLCNDELRTVVEKQVLTKLITRKWCPSSDTPTNSERQSNAN